MLVCLKGNTHSFNTCMLRSNFTRSRWQTLTHSLNRLTCTQHCQQTQHSSGQSMSEAALGSTHLGRGRSAPSDSNKQFQLGSASLSYIQCWLHALPCPPASQFIPLQRVKHDQQAQKWIWYAQVAWTGLAVRWWSFTFSMRILYESITIQIWEQPFSSMRTVYLSSHTVFHFTNYKV